MKAKKGSMSKPDPEFDVDRYRKMLAEATDEKKRLALIELLIEEQAKERLMRHDPVERVKAE